MVLATLTFAIQERLWYEASLQVRRLIRLNIDVKSLVQKLETICCGAISDNQYHDATGAMDILLEQDIFRDISRKVIPCVEAAIGNIWEVWDTAKGTRWASGHNIFNSVYLE